MSKQNLDMTFGKQKKPATFSLEEEDANENWQPILGFEGLYAISDLGRVRRLAAGTNSYAGKILAPIINRKTGYPYVKLCKQGKTKKAKLHLLVAEAFLDKPPNENFIVNHVSGVKTEAAVSNLEYISRSDNTKHAIAMGLQSLCYGTDNGRAKLTDEQVKEIIARSILGDTTQAEIAKIYGISKTYVNNILKGKYRSSKREL